MGLEASSWNWLRSGILKTLPHFALLERVENGVHVGTADVNYCIRGTEGWIELKAVDLPARESTPVLGKQGLNKDQINWHLARQQVLSRTWVFVTAAPYRWLISGLHAREINNWTRDDLCLHAHFYYDDKWGSAQWRTLIKILSDKYTEM